MMKPSASDRLVFISAAEPSADQHAAGLIEAMRRLRPGVRFVGVGGPKMAAGGCDVVFDMTAHASMLLGALANVGRGIAMLNTCDRHLRARHFDAAVVVDSPVLHLPLAAKAHAQGIPVLYYIAPQMWAWGKYRIYKLRHRTRQVACILPFEQTFFREQGIDATFVGHPLAEQAAAAFDEQAVARIRAKGKPLVALLPGSRKHVVESLLADQLAVAREIAAVFPNAAFGISVAGPHVRPIIAEATVSAPPRTELYTLDRIELLKAADLVLVASGTAALEVAFHGRPMIVMYKASRLFYHGIARWMLSTRRLSLPNILAGDEVVPEFMPYYRDHRAIARCAIALLSSEDRQAEMSARLEQAVAPLRGGSASANTARLLLDIIEEPVRDEARTATGFSRTRPRRAHGGC